eukprot:GGOE01041331.1.p1 GENE.GGOE01041331.1~~GGOE01041331.1.p1  ORF type:complete len:334 (-),score=95.01 GGOE01041331.1:232-1200(-)
MSCAPYYAGAADPLSSPRSSSAAAALQGPLCFATLLALLAWLLLLLPNWMAGLGGGTTHTPTVFLESRSGKVLACKKSLGLVAVVGAGGPMGLECVRLLQKEGVPVRAVVRNPAKDARKLVGVKVVAGDVADEASLTAAFTGSSAVVFAASASSYAGAGGPYQVDYLGVRNTAAAARATHVKQVVLLSSRLVNPVHRWHPIRFLLNSLRWNLMDRKYDGEEALRHARVPYTIVRPGGLTGGEGQRVGGPPGTDHLLVAEAEGFLEGATSIHRADVAAVVLEALRSEAAKFKTVEVVARPREEGDPQFEEHLHTLFATIPRDP